MPSDPTFAYPPLHHHTSTPLPPTTASTPLAAYLEKSLTRPYLHPDAWLSLEGVRHGPKSGPQGSWALHHLRRIEAGMRGEVLAVESTEELVGKFGEEIVGEAMGVRSGQGFRREGESGGVVGAEEGVDVGDEEAGVQDVREHKKAAPQAEKPEHLMTKAEKKKARRAAEKAEIAKARERGEDVPSFGRKRKRNNNDGQSEADDDAQSSAVGDSQHHNANINDPSQFESARSYSLSQKPVLEDLGDRDPAGVDRENAVSAPVVVEHDEEGGVVVPPPSSEGKKKHKRKPSTAYEETEEKEAKRAAKKAKREEGKQAKDTDVEMGDAPNGVVEGLSRKAKRKEREEKEREGLVNGNGIGGQVNGTPGRGEKKGKKKRGSGKKGKEGKKGNSSSS